MNQINISAKIVAGTNRNKRTKATSTTNLAVDGAPAASSGQPIDASKFVAKDSSVLQTIASPIAVNGAFSATSIAENGVLLSAKYITPAGVDAKINAIINAAPTTLDTLSELATALGNDPNFATTITNLIGTKAPLASPNFSGIPKVDGNVIFHAGNANLPTVQWSASDLSLGNSTTHGIYMNNGTSVHNIVSRNDGFLLFGRNGIRNDFYIDANGDFNIAGITTSENNFISKVRHTASFIGNWQHSGYWGIGEDEASGSYWVKLQGWYNVWNNNPVNLNVTGEVKVGGARVASSNQNGSGFTAAGWQIGDYSNLNNLDVRSRLQVYEFVQNKINISNGNLIVTDSAKVDYVWFWKDGGVTGTGQHVRYSFAEQHPFNVGDIIRCQYKGKSYIVTVGYIDNTRLFFDAYNSYNNAGVSDSAAGDLLIRWDSNDANRKGLLYLNSSDTNAPNFQVVHGGAVKGCFGNCAGLNWQGAPLPANTWAVWVKGGYFDEVNVRGSITVTGGNAETVTGAQAKADAALSAANYQLTLLNNSLGSLAYKSAVGSAMLDTSVIVGGYIKTSLLDVSSIIVSGGIAKTTDLSTAIGNKFTYIDSSGVYTGTLTANQVKATNAVFSTANISDAAITQVKIVDGAITTAKITDAAITGAKIASATITDANILSLNADKIVAGKIKAQYIESDKITALGAITAGSFNLGNGAFSVSTEGILSATGATIKGTITADSGKISGFALANNTVTATGASNEVLLNSSEGFLKITGVSQAVGNYYSQLGVKALEGENQSLLGVYSAGYFSIGSAPAANKNIALYAKGTFINGYNAAIYATGRIITDQSVYDWGYNDEIAVLPATITLHVVENLKYLIGHGFSGKTLIYQLPRLSEIQNSLFATNDENFMITLKIIVKHDSGNVAINPSLDYPLYNNNGNSISGQSLSRGDSVDVTIIKQDGSVWAQFNNYAF